MTGEREGEARAERPGRLWAQLDPSHTFEPLPYEGGFVSGGVPHGGAQTGGRHRGDHAAAQLPVDLSGDGRTDFVGETRFHPAGDRSLSEDPEGPHYGR